VRAVSLIALVCLCLGGCVAQSVEQLEARAPSRVFFSGERPPAVITALSLSAENTAGAVEYVDQAASRLVISNKNMYGARVTLLVVRAEPKDDGSTVTMWFDGVRPVVGSQWEDKLWAAYTKKLDVAATPYHTVQADAPKHLRDE
jgi:hypothetical protein